MSIKHPPMGTHLQVGDGAPQDEGVDVVGALVRVHCLQVHHVAND